MAAKAIVPGEAFPCIYRFRGHGPLLQKPSRAADVGVDRAFVGAAHGRESNRSG